MLGLASAQGHQHLRAVVPDSARCERAVREALDDAVAYGRNRNVELVVERLDSAAVA